MATARAPLPLALALAALVIVLDQASKWAILTQVMTPPRVVPVTGFFNLVLTFNEGVSFGLLSSDAAWQPWLLSGFAVVVVIALLLWLRRSGSRLLALAVGLVAGGALGNVIDRLRLGAVVDFLDFHLAGWHWPAFNLADSAITVGVLMIICHGLFAGDAAANNEARLRE